MRPLPKQAEKEKESDVVDNDKNEYPTERFYQVKSRHLVAEVIARVK